MTKVRHLQDPAVWGGTTCCGGSDSTLLQGSQQGQIPQALTEAKFCSWPVSWLGWGSAGHREEQDFGKLEILNNEQ